MEQPEPGTHPPTDSADRSATASATASATDSANAPGNAPANAPANAPDAPPGASRALEGIGVVDLSQNLAGPFATQILADLGADVLKVEPPGGDPARAWGPPFRDGQSPLFLCANRNKHGLTLDLGTESGRRRLRDLVADADVFVQAFRHGVAARLGCDHDTIRALNPGIIYVSVTAFGDTGPRRDQPGYDPLMQAFGGIMSVTGEADGEPVRVGTSVVDLGTGMWAALGVMAALRARDRTGKGSHVVVSLMETAVTWMSYHLQGYLSTGDVPRPQGTGLGMIAPYQAFPAGDGRLMIAAGNDASFRRLCVALDLPELANDPRFRTNADRVAHREELVGRIATRTRRRSVAELEALLQEARVPCSPIHDVAEVAADPQVRATGILREVGNEAYPDIALPVTWDGERAPFRTPPPAPEVA